MCLRQRVHGQAGERRKRQNKRNGNAGTRWGEGGRMKGSPRVLGGSSLKLGVLDTG